MASYVFFYWRAQTSFIVSTPPPPLSSDVDQDTYKCLACTKDPQLIFEPSLRTYKSRYEKETKEWFFHKLWWPSIFN